MIIKTLKTLRHWFRSSVTGRFVSKLFAEDNPDTTERGTKRKGE